MSESLAQALAAINSGGTPIRFARAVVLSSTAQQSVVQETAVFGPVTVFNTVQVGAPAAGVVCLVVWIGPVGYLLATFPAGG